MNYKGRLTRAGRRALGGAALLAACTSLVGGAPAVASPLKLTWDYSADLMTGLSGGTSRGVRHADDLNLGADLDLQEALGWRGASAHLDLSSTGGGAPSEIAGAAQGIDGLEAGSQRLRAYQAWIEAPLGTGLSGRVGLTDLSGEFATADSAGVLLNPSFGMSPDFAASGAAAYPSTSLAVRLRYAPTEGAYAQVALANARPGVPGDRGGADTTFNDGSVLVAEAGLTGAGKVAVGFWRATRSRDDLVELDSAGDPVRRTAQGAYAVAERPLGGPVTGFFRLGVADGRTAPFRSSAQAGLLVQPAFSARPESMISAGVTVASLGRAYRDTLGPGATPSTETVVEVTYSDQIAPHLRIQPDLQFVHHPAAAAGIKDALVAGLRLQVGF